MKDFFETPTPSYTFEIFPPKGSKSLEEKRRLQQGLGLWEQGGGVTGGGPAPPPPAGWSPNSATGKKGAAASASGAKSAGTSRTS